MEKVYMELPKKNLRVWKNDDISPYDFVDNAKEKIDTNIDIHPMERFEDIKNRTINSETIEKWRKKCQKTITVKEELTKNLEEN